MIEPVQNCFTFYRPDGKTEAQIYSSQDELSDSHEDVQPAYNVAQQDLSLNSSQNKSES